MEEGMAGPQVTAGRRGGLFEAFDVALRRASLSGTVDVAGLPRAAESLAPEGGAAHVSWRIAGTADAFGRPALEISLNGAVPLVCQRCLLPFSWPVAQRTVLLLARDERELAMLDGEDEHEVVLAAAPLDAATLTEDELLLTMPFVPRCTREACVVSTLAPGRADASTPVSAFAALADAKAMIAKRSKD
jgi:DUF177 domain-containing protein